MTPAQLKQQLSEQYSLVCFEDFAKLTQHTGFLYEILQQHHQVVYQPDQKLVFYTQHQVNLNQLCHLQLASSLIDISNSFIIVCSPYDLAGQLETANQQHGHDHQVIECKIVDLDSTELLSTEVISLDTLCPLPWMHLEVGNMGYLHTCCLTSESLGHVQQDQIQDIFHGTAMQNIRLQMLRGEKPDSCQHCWKQESYGQRSPRQGHLAMYQKDLLSSYLHAPKIRSLDIKLGNTCNFKCKICSKYFSSQFASEDLKYAGTPQQVSEIRRVIDLGKRYESDHHVLDQLDTIWPELLNLDIIGGEPFLLKQLADLLGRVAKSSHSEHIRLRFSTNGSVFPANLIDTLSSFRLVDIGISADNIGQKFEIERGGLWDNIQSNIQQFLLLDRKKFRVYVLCTVNIQNVLDLDEIYQWGDQTGIDIVFNLLDRPDYLSINNLTTEGQKLVISKYQHSDRPELRAIAAQVANSQGSDGVAFVAAMKQFDQRRQQNFILSHNAIAIAMGFTV